MRRLTTCCFGFVIAVASLAAQDGPPRNPAEDFVALGPVQPLPAPIARGVEQVTAAALAAHVALLASPALEGRGLGSAGLEAATEYVATSLALAGIPPLSPATGGAATAAYFQSVPMRQVSNAGGEVVVDAWQGDAVSTRAFGAGVDVLFPDVAPQEITAPVVFAGYGIRETSPARDDYVDLAVKGTIVVVLGGVPDGPEWQTEALRAKYDAERASRRHAAKVALAAAQGARAVLVVERRGLAADLETASREVAPFFLPYDAPATSGPLVARVSSAIADALFAAARVDPAQAATMTPRELRGATVTIRITGDERLALGRNVLGLLRGSDPSLAAEAVVMGAHVDHLGRRAGVVHPGADDNASGVAALLEIAKAFAASGTRPKRTIVFAFWTAEEEGHLGSDSYVRHPAWPLEKTAAYLNLDMIGHPWTAGEIRQLVTDAKLPDATRFLAATPPADFLEVGLAEWSPELAPFIVRAARGTGVALHVDRTDGKSGGSDYRAFARRDVPWLRFFGNYFDGYHEPRDTADRLDAAQVRKMARLALATAWLIADK